ncbi:MAG: hypothetical protein LBQ47_02195 [Endomicrobium sp.]|jgi:hypothetical protein|nr:hypothetical protein [Endomicrobium sp.]
MRNYLNKIIYFFDPHAKGALFTRFGISGVLVIAIIALAVYCSIVFKIQTFAGWLFANIPLFIHEPGHKIFNILFGGNMFMTVIGGTAMEIIVPLWCFLYFQRKGWVIQSDICLLLLALSFKSIGHYTGAQVLDDEITLINAAEPITDWDYMHKWFHTVGKEYYMRYGFYILSSFTAGVGFWLLGAHIYKFFKEPINMRDES